MPRRELWIDLLIDLSLFSERHVNTVQIANAFLHFLKLNIDRGGFPEPVYRYAIVYPLNKVAQSH